MLEVITILGACYIVLFGIAYKIKDNSIVDVFWGAGFLIVSLIVIFQNTIFGLSQIITFLLILVWSLRIVISIGSKKLKTKREDKRYAIWRETWKYFYLRSFFQVYILQMLLLLFVAIPLIIIFSDSSEISQKSSILYSIFGGTVALFGLSYQSIADYQLKKYLTNSPAKNTIFTGGLWNYSRHPNYFGESFFWLGISTISLQYSIYGIIGFIIITLLLVFVSGVPLKEKSYKTKINYKKYSQKTPLFIPKYSKK